MNFDLNEDGYAVCAVGGFDFEVVTIGKSLRVKLKGDNRNQILGDACDVFEADQIIDQYVLSKSEAPRAQFGSLYLAAASVFAAKQDIRYYLNGIYVEPVKDGGVNLVGTDGRRMVVIHDSEGWANRSFIVPSNSALMSICKKRPRYKKGDKLPDCVTTVVVDGEMIYAMKDWYRRESDVDLKDPSRAQVHSRNLHCSWPFHEVEGRYPNWRGVIPSESGEIKGGHMAVNPNYVADLVNVQKILVGPSQAGYSGVVARQFSESSATMFRFMHHDMGNVFALIMPMRYDTPSQFVPDFCK